MTGVTMGCMHAEIQPYLPRALGLGLSTAAVGRLLLAAVLLLLDGLAGAGAEGLVLAFLAGDGSTLTLLTSDLSDLVEEPVSRRLRLLGVALGVSEGAPASNMISSF